MAEHAIMRTLRKSMEEYLTMRRSLGFKLHEAGQRLEDFVRFMGTASGLSHQRVTGVDLGTPISSGFNR